MADATIILAGGAGTRLWPASLRHHPKQLLRIGGGRSLIQRAVALALAATPRGPIVVVTAGDQVDAIVEHVNELAGEEPALQRRMVYLAEPVGRNTAPAIALAAAWLRKELGADATALVLTADHVIGPPERFAADAAAAGRAAASGHLVCFGIVPDRPETGYGYIRAGEALDDGYRVLAFTEKPDRATAEEYLARGGYFWNAGMFCFRIGLFLEELAEHAPAVARPLSESGPPAVSTRAGGARFSDPTLLAPLYDRLPKISVDYAVMEKSSRVAVVAATFSWNDVGSWDQVAQISGETPGGAAPVGETPRSGGADRPPVIEVEAGGNFIDADLPVAVCGVSDIHVVVKNGKVLVCRRGSGQLVKQVVESLEEAGRTDLL